MFSRSLWGRVTREGVERLPTPTRPRARDERELTRPNPPTPACLPSSSLPRPSSVLRVLPSPLPFPQDLPQPEPTHDDNGEPIAPSQQPKIALLASFMDFITSRIASTDASSNGPAYAVLLASLAHFTAAFLTASTTDVHSLVQAYDPDSRKEILSAYFRTLSALEAKFGASQVPRQPKSGLFAAAEKGEAELYALFGGQGTNEVGVGSLLLGSSARAMVGQCR